MHVADYIVLGVYLAGIFVVGLGLSLKVKDTNDLFTAGGRSPWWASGLSGFMTMFSAGTFVVWGGIAYKFGFVAVMINLMYGIAALLVGFFVAGKWKRMGLGTPAQFTERRFGVGALHFYTWSMMLYRMIGVGVALYSLAVLLVALIPLGQGNLLRDPATGNLSLSWAILIFGGVVVIYTMIGGLWAVLMTDVMQFIVLNLSVLFMVPLILLEVGGVSGFVADAPKGFFMPTAGGYTWFFLAGWCAIHFFMVGAEWAFAQRYICVSSQRDARKSAFLFGALYLVSPILWLAPPLAWRVINPIPEGATEAQVNTMAEQAYVLACKHVLPVGMVGLMLAAMFSATASMVSSQLNVFAGVLTEDVYAKLRHTRDDGELLWAGRIISLLLGAGLIGLALGVPVLGGAEKVVIGITELAVVSLLAPTIWGMFSRPIGGAAVWVTGLAGLGVGLLVRFGFAADGLLANIDALTGVSAWVQAYDSMLKTLIGVVLPVILLGVMTMLSMSKGESEGWRRVEAGAARFADGHSIRDRSRFDPAPANIVAGCLGACGLMMAALTVVNEQGQGTIALFSVALLALAALIAGWAGRTVRVSRGNVPPGSASVAEDV